MFKQLPLSITLRVDSTFDNFHMSEANALAVSALKAFGSQCQEQFCYLWGASGSGVTHLLQAVQHAAKHLSIQYLPLSELIEYPVEEVCAGLEQLDLVVIDDIHSIVGLAHWEVGLFHLYNRLRDNGKQLLVGAHAAPRYLGVNLQDLESRLQWGMVYQLQPLVDKDKVIALCARAAGLGLELSDDVVQFMMNHGCRDIHHLMAVLETMDQASLVECRRLTIPFLKQVLDL